MVEVSGGSCCQARRRQALDHKEPTELREELSITSIDCCWRRKRNAVQRGELSSTQKLKPCSSAAPGYPPSQHHHTDPATVLLVRLIRFVNATSDRRCAPVEEVVMQLAVAAAELVMVEEERIVLQREGVEDVEFGLGGYALVEENDTAESVGKQHTFFASTSASPIRLCNLSLNFFSSSPSTNAASLA